MNLHKKGYACVVPSRGYTCAVPPRHVAAVTARVVFPTTGDMHVLMSNTNIRVGFQEISRFFLTGDASPISVTAKKGGQLPTAQFSYLCVTVTGLE